MLHFVFVGMQCMLLSKEFSKDVFYSTLIPQHILLEINLKY